MRAGELAIVANFGDQCGEGPLWHEVDQALYWIDITGRRLARCRWPSGQSEIVREGLEVGGFALADAGFVLVNSSGIWHWDRTDNLVLLASHGGGRLNDCTADPDGRLFTGSTYFSDDRDDYQRGYLFRVDLDASVHAVDEGIGLSNGSGFSPDARTFYFTDSAERAIYSYDYRRSDGSLHNRRTFVKVPIGQGVPDGLTVDADGFVWSALWFGARVVRYDPDGKTERTIHTPAAQTSSVAFGGTDLTDIFITSAAVTGALSLAPPSYSADLRHLGGEVFHLNLGIPGKLEYKAQIASPVAGR